MAQKPIINGFLGKNKAQKLGLGQKITKMPKKPVFSGFCHFHDFLNKIYRFFS